ncbi:MAG: beta-lactamase family protein [Acidobacteriota bacterium]|nr:beta-lactamase family protein [Acidobacteriota bacterium]
MSGAVRPAPYRPLRLAAAAALLLPVLCLPAACRAQQVDSAAIAASAERILHQTGVPGATVGVAMHGHIVYTAGFGAARLVPYVAARPEMRFPIGSITKQFTAAGLLLLAEQGKLSLDDPVSRWFPELTRAHEVTLRNLLTHTSGYQDYAPQDYTLSAWTRPVDPLAVVHTWAGKPLDFAPGTQWQYSNTNFLLATLILERASGEPYGQFLRHAVLQPLGIADALDLDTDRDRMEPTGYQQYALAAPRPALLEAPGWYTGDANLVLSVADLLQWDLSLIDHSLLRPASYAALAQSFHLRDGTDTGYGLGLESGVVDGHRVLQHSGEVGGFVAQNTVYPDDGVAIAVLTNEEASTAAPQIAEAIARQLLPAAPETPPVAQLHRLLLQLARGTVDRSQLTPDLSDYFNAEALADFRTSLAPLGTPTSFRLTQQEARGGMTLRLYRVEYVTGTRVTVSTYSMPDGRLEQLLVSPAE